MADTNLTKIDMYEQAIAQTDTTSINEDTLYNIKDMPVGGITNAQMVLFTQSTHLGLLPVGAVFKCIDSGTYTKGQFYKYTGNSWVAEEVLMDFNQVERKLIEETYTITSNSWMALSSSEPFTYQTTVTATYTIGNNTEVGIINDQPVLFANYGFIVGSVSGQNVTLYAIEQPDTSVTLKIGYRG